MLRKEKNGIHWLEFELLANFPKLKHGVFLRHGGKSLEPYSSLNLGVWFGDDKNHVEHNRNQVSEILGVSELVSLKQTHGKEIHEILSPLTEVLEGDALVTAQVNLALTILHADCQAAIFYDPINHKIANAHAGWRGNVQNIYADTIAFMQRKYKSDPKDLLVCISPSLGPQSAEFIHYKNELPEAFWKFQVTPNYFDLWAISEFQLTEAGILSKNIEIAKIDTKSNPEDFFSYRRAQISGRHATVIVLK